MVGFGKPTASKGLLMIFVTEPLGLCQNLFQPKAQDLIALSLKPSASTNILQQTQVSCMTEGYRRGYKLTESCNQQLSCSDLNLLQLLLITYCGGSGLSLPTPYMLQVGKV